MNRTFRYLVVTLVLALASFTTGCVKKQTPQYNTAIVLNDVAHTLTGLQDGEIALHKAGFVPDDKHREFQLKMHDAFVANDAANTATEQNDLVTAKSKYTAIVSILQSIPPEAVGIKDPTSQSIYTILLNTALNVIKQFA